MRAPLRLAAWALFLIGCHSGGGSAATPEADAEFRVQGDVGLRRTCSPTGIERCYDARDDNCNGLIDEGCGLPTGLVQFVIAWDQAVADVDLNVVGPDGELAEVGRATSSGLVKERDCPGRDQACHGQNVENVYLEDGDAVRGEYEVRIRLEKLEGATPPIHVTLGARVGPKTYSAEVELTLPEDERVLTLEL
jgi:hypothetical protein